MFARIAFLIAFIFSTTSYAEHHESALTDLQEATEALIAAVTKNREEMTKDRRVLHLTVNGIARPHFDFKRMSGLALGKWWRRATDLQKEQFEREFSDLVIRTYATAVLGYTDQDIKWHLSDPDKKKVKVSAKITDQNGIVIDVVFKMAKSKRYEGWRVFDVTIEGISIVLTYRSTFNEEARVSGVGGVIESLKTKNGR
jgi:phospholipid transport system substrate-binding protein